MRSSDEKQKYNNYAQSLMPTHVAIKKYHWSESSSVQKKDSLNRVSVAFQGTKHSFTEFGLRKNPI